jgi:photosystem II stability/assembly factor-like uncharacterized protein
VLFRSGEVGDPTSGAVASIEKVRPQTALRLRVVLFVAASLAVLLSAAACSGSSGAPAPSPTLASSQPASATPALTPLEPSSVSWLVQRAEPASGHTGALNAIAFGDAQNGWAVGAPGVILHTSDGGLTWRRQSAPGLEPAPVVNPQGPNLADVAAVGANHAWLVVGGTEGVIYATDDGGVHWRRQRSGRPPLALITFADTRHGWAAGNGIMRTTDGGVHWTQVFPSSSATVGGLTCTDAGHVWATRGDAVLSSSDGGRTWRSARVDPHFSLGAIEFTDAQHGWALGEDDSPDANPDGNPPAIVMRTSDGGRSWQEQRFGVTDPNTKRILYALAFANSTDGWVLGYDFDGSSDGPYPTVLLRTIDGGASWQVQDPLNALVNPQTMPASARDGGLWDVAAVADGRAWLVGDYEVVLTNLP